jgi:adenylate kinase family enzyme
MSKFNWERIVVVGVTGSGKTTLARTLAQRFNMPHVEFDSLYWGPGWSETPREVFRERIAHALSDAHWVADGNYGQARDIVWRRATHLIWLDYDWLVIFERILRRTLQRVFTREELWNGNRENLRDAFFSRDSLFIWALTSRPKQRRDYPTLFRSPEYSHLNVIRLNSPRATQHWLTDLIRYA